MSQADPMHLKEEVCLTHLRFEPFSSFSHFSQIDIAAVIFQCLHAVDLTFRDAQLY